MNSICILQARTSSSRLPGKVLLPINGIPIVILAAKRASNLGRKVIVVTSSESSDDGLVELIKLNGLEYFRGSLENVLSRVVGALDGYDENTIVIRLTADNIFPDGALLDEMEAEFLEKELRYLCSADFESGLPYGVSAELMYLRDLRDANRAANESYDQEHVTPYLIRKYGKHYFVKYQHLKSGSLRCTIDDFSDYIAIQKIFSGVRDPINESFLNLISVIKKSNASPVKLIVGCAQLGGGYGITNITNTLGAYDCRKLIESAIANGVEYLDTARAYRSSEENIGRALSNGLGNSLKIITKLSPLVECPVDANELTVKSFVDASLFQSCISLKRQKLDVLMLHRFSHLSDWDGAVWKRLLGLRKSGIIGDLGVSIQSPNELLHAIRIPEITFIQIPYNLLDWRFDHLESEILAEKSRRNLIIHARSVFLQGLLLSSNNQHWVQANMDLANNVKDWLIKQVMDCNRRDIADLCISYVKSTPWIDGMVVGVDNEKQLLENINYTRYPILNKDHFRKIRNTRPLLAEDTLNPALWRKSTK